MELGSSLFVHWIGQWKTASIWTSSTEVAASALKPKEKIYFRTVTRSIHEHVSAAIYRVDVDIRLIALCRAQYQSAHISNVKELHIGSSYRLDRHRR